MGEWKYQLPRVHSAAAGMRLAGVIDEIARTRYDPLREYLVKMLARFGLARPSRCDSNSRRFRINQFAKYQRVRTG